MIQSDARKYYVHKFIFSIQKGSTEKVFFSVFQLNANLKLNTKTKEVSEKKMIAEKEIKPGDGKETDKMFCLKCYIQSKHKCSERKILGE